MSVTTEQKIDPELLEKVKVLMRKTGTNIREFCLFFMKDAPEHNFTVPTRDYRVYDNVPKFQEEIFTRLYEMKRRPRLALASPRGFMKSMTCSIMYPLWGALFGHYKQILIVSNSESLAINFLRNIRINIESNDRINRYFGDMRSPKWTENHLILRNGTNIRACGWGAQIRGFRPDLIILDDIESDETVASEDVRNKMREWLLKAALNSLRVDGSILFIGTLINRVSILYDWIHNPPAGWDAIFNQAYRDGVQEEGHELWPDVWGHERLQRRKGEIGSWAFSSEFMNEPIPSEGNRFNPNHLKWFDDKDLEGKSLGMYITIDPAFSEERTADFGVIMVCLHDSDDNIYVDRYFRDRTTAAEIIQRFKRFYREHKQQIRAVGVEEVGPQKAFYQQLVNECNQEGLYPPFEKLVGMISTQRGNMRNKKDRVTYALQPRIESGKLHLRRDQKELIEEMTLFPEGKHDDMVDALAYITALLKPFMDYSIIQQLDDLDEEVINRGTTGYGDEYEIQEARVSY